MKHFRLVNKRWTGKASPPTGQAVANQRSLSRAVLDSTYEKIIGIRPNVSTESKDSEEWEQKGIAKQIGRGERDATTMGRTEFADWIKEREKMEAIDIQMWVTGDWVVIPYDDMRNKPCSFLEFHFLVREALKLPIRNSSTSLKIWFLANKMKKETMFRPMEIIPCHRTGDCRSHVRGCQFQVYLHKPLADVPEPVDQASAGEC